MINRVILSIIFTTIFSGCSFQETRPESSSIATPLQKTMMASAEQIAKTSRILAEIKNAELNLSNNDDTLNQLYKNATRLPAGLDKPISLSWHGDAVKALKLINRLTAFGEVRVYGEKPLNGAIVNIEANTRSAYDVIRDIGVQLGSSADIRVIEPAPKGSGAIEIHYAKN